ncbi:rho-GTPase-activating protein 5 [Nannizzia gypsea CBS 118893]|uniref:Rho-GTPase-activating protein 5 n=1 Tax=Arthroderma gypseum (strain ATCC MYA-4604 / CBS 118893) TaxID=535722 RepID=E4UXQ0_ARTGP|nr:rho-GTPase-activating protein 5 [Nannizzia gypsea CBS 118893]EFR01945.1 rho-GTPase-activating protein 5 [Nannizzia gypsea CBS 118893]
MAHSHSQAQAPQPSGSAQEASTATTSSASIATPAAATSASALLNSSSTAHSPPSKRDLASWWRQFKRSTKKDTAPQAPPGIFGIPLNVSIKYANVAISLTGDDGKSFIYGYVPIVVAKCGVFLKEKATDVEGIFRLSGSAKRIKDLQEIFNSPDRFGKGLDWTGYTVHDAANILRRYLNQLPEPIVPLDFYERFREPLRHRQGRPDGEEAAILVDKEHGFDRDAAVVAVSAAHQGASRRSTDSC